MGSEVGHDYERLHVCIVEDSELDAESALNLALLVAPVCFHTSIPVNVLEALFLDTVGAPRRLDPSSLCMVRKRPVAV